MSGGWACDRCGVAVGAFCNPITGDSRRALCYDCAQRERDDPTWRRYSRASVVEAVRYAWYIGTMDSLQSAMGYDYAQIPQDVRLRLLAKSHDQALELDGTVQMILDVVDGYAKPDRVVLPEVN